MRQISPKITDAKIKEDIFVGPQISYIIHEKEFEELLVALDKIACKGFKDVTENFLDNYRAKNYNHINYKLHTTYKTVK